MSYKILPPPTPGLRYVSAGAYCLSCERHVAILRIAASSADGPYFFQHRDAAHVVADWPY